jgi:MYXO-CTERM domain-containing protein
MPHSAARRVCPAALLGLALLAGPGCTETSSVDNPGDPPVGAVRGELSYNVASFDDGHSETDYFLHVPGQAEPGIQLKFDSEPDVAGGTQLDVWGSPENGQLRVSHFEVVKPVIAVQQQALVNAMDYPARSFAFGVVHIGTPPMELPMADATRKLFGVTPNPVPSVRQYYVEVSYGRQDIGGQVFGPLEYTPVTNCQGGAMNTLANTMRAMIPGTFNHYLWYLEPRTAACQWSGLASSGRPEKPSRDTWYNGSSGCVVLVQEPGHNFGMQHSSSMKCTEGGMPVTFSDQPMGPCVHSEYGDRYDPMGGGCRHMNAFQKAYQGWFDKCNLVDSPVSGTFTLVPLELPCDGVQAITVPFPHVRPFTRSGGGGGATTDQLTNYLIEMRAPIGIDNGITPTNPVVQIRATSALRDRTQRGLHTWFLDMKPETPALDGLGAGESFTDPTGSPKITVLELDGTHASVKVEFTTPAPAGMVATCLDDTPFQGPGPGIESCAKAPAAPSGGQPAIPDGGAPPAQPPKLDGGRNPGRDSSAPVTADAGAPPSGEGTGGATGTGGSGAGGSGGSAGTGGSAGSGGAAGAPAGPVTVSSGCGCRVGSSGGNTGGGLLAFGLAVAALVVRRRRRSS